MKKVVLSLSFLILLGAGCNRIGQYTIKANISPALNKTFTASTTNPTTVRELMYQMGNKFEFSKNLSNTDTVTKVEGVIATASKEWNLYINDKKVTYTDLGKIIVKPSDTIEWRYEETK